MRAPFSLVAAPLATAAPLVLTGCISSAEPLRYVIEPAVSAAVERVRTSADTILVAEVSLPDYARETRLFIETEENTLDELEDADWADEPDRAFGNVLVRELTRITGSEVAIEPWPLGGVPEAELRVRVSHMVRRNDGILEMAGHYAIRRDEAESRSAIELFSLQVPAPSPAPADVVRAHAVAWRELATIIARSL